jgi:hypothetical protein
MGDIRKYYVGADIHKGYVHTDKEINVKNNVRYMLNRSNIMFQWHNLPNTIPQREIELLLQSNGYGVITEINGDLYVVNASLGGEYDVYNRPTRAVISVPYLNYNADLQIDKECIVIPNDTMYMGLLTLFEKYCTFMNENEITMLLTTVNKRVQTLLSANDDNTVESAKTFIKKLFDGELGVIAENKLFDSLKVNKTNEGNSSNLKDLIEYQQYLKASLYNEIGLNANYNMKRERLNTAEIEINSENLYPLVDDMLDCRRLAIEKINDMYNLNIEVEFNSSWDYRVFNGASIHNTESEVDENASVDNTDNSGDSVVADTDSATSTDDDTVGNDTGDTGEEQKDDREDTADSETDDKIEDDTENVSRETSKDGDENVDTEQSENNDSADDENEDNTEDDKKDKE